MKEQAFNIRGIVTDTDYAKASSDYALDIMNMRISKRNEEGEMYALTTEKGNVSVNFEGDDFPQGGTIMGHCEIQNYIVLFISDLHGSDYIYRLEDIGEQLNYNVKCLYNGGDLGFADYGVDIDAKGVYENDNIIKVYWIDNVHQPRFINIMNETTDYLSQDAPFDFQGVLKLTETVNIVKEYSFGIFSPGTIQYILTYYNLNGKETRPFYISPINYINFRDRGGSPEELVTCCFKISISNFDNINYEYIRIYSVQRTSENGTPICKLCKEIDIANTNQTSVSFMDIGTEGESKDYFNLLYVGGTNIVPKTFDQKDNTLFFGNYDTPTLLVDTEVNLDKALFVHKEPVNKTSVSQYAYDNSLDYDASLITGYKGGEYYRFGIAFYDKYGNSTSIVDLGQYKNSLYPKDTLYNYKEVGFLGTLTPNTIQDLVNEGFIGYRLYYKPPIIGTVQNQGAISPTVFNGKERSENIVWAQSSWFYRDVRITKFRYYKMTNDYAVSTSTALPQNLTPLEINAPFFENDFPFKEFYNVFSDTSHHTTPLNTWELHPYNYGTNLYSTSSDGTNVNTHHPTEAIAFTTYGSNPPEYYYLECRCLVQYLHHHVIANKFNPAYDIDRFVCRTLRTYKETVNSWNYHYNGNNGSTDDEEEELKGFMKDAVNVKDENGSFYKSSVNDYHIKGFNNKRDFRITRGMYSDLYFYDSKHSYLKQINSAWNLVDGDASPNGNTETNIQSIRWHGFTSGNDGKFYPTNFILNDGEIMGASSEDYIYDNNTNNISDLDFFIDWNTLTLDAPDIMFNPNKNIYEKVRIVGLLPLTGNLSKRELTVDNKYSIETAEGDLYGKHFIESNSENNFSMTESSRRGQWTKMSDFSWYEKFHNLYVIPHFSYRTESLASTIQLPGGTCKLNGDSYKIYTSVQGNPVAWVDYEDDYIPWVLQMHPYRYWAPELPPSTPYSMKYPNNYNYVFQGCAYNLIFPWHRKGSLTGQGQLEDSGTEWSQEGDWFWNNKDLMEYQDMIGTNARSSLRSSGITFYLNEGNNGAYSCDIELQGLYESTNFESPVVLKGLDSNIKLYKGAYNRAIIPENAYHTYSLMVCNFYDTNLDNSTEAPDGTFPVPCRFGFLYPYKHEDLYQPIPINYKSSNHLVLTLANKEIVPYLKYKNIRTDDSQEHILEWMEYCIGEHEYNYYEDSSHQGSYIDLHQISNQSNEDIYSLNSLRGLMAKGFVYLAETYNTDAQYEIPSEGQWYAASGIEAFKNNGFEEELYFIYGDTYFQRYDCLKTFPYTEEDNNQIIHILSFMCETKINIAGRYDKRRGWQDNLSTRDTNFNLLNKAYTQKDNLFGAVYISDNLYTETHPNSIIWSLTKINGEAVDSWTQLNLASNMDMDGVFGGITAIKLFKNNLLAFQDEAIARIQYNERQVVTTQSGVPLELANSNKVQGREYISTNVGCLSKHSIETTERALYFVDLNKKTLFKYGEGLLALSTMKGVASIFDKLCTNNLYLWVDKGYNEIYIRNTWDDNLKEAWSCLVYNEDLDTFMSWLDYDAAFMFSFKKSFISIPVDWESYEDCGYIAPVGLLSSTLSLDGGLYKHHIGSYLNYYNSFDFDFAYPYWVTIVSNGGTLNDKTFTNIEFVADYLSDHLELATNSDDTLASNNIEPFTYIACINEYQSGRGGFKRMIRKGTNLSQKFRTWQADIPRANNKYLERFRNPYLIISLGNDCISYEDCNPYVIMHNLKVKYI